MHRITTLRSQFVCKCIISPITIDIECTTTSHRHRFPYFHHGMRKHGLKIIIGVSIWSIVPICIWSFFENKLVDWHGCSQNMVSDKHVQSIETISIIRTSADFQSIFTHIVIPIWGITIHLIGISYQVVNIIDSICTHHFIRLCKDSITDFTVNCTCRTCAISRWDGRTHCCTWQLFIFEISSCICQYRIGQSCQMKGLIENRISLFVAFKHIANKTRKPRYYVVNDMY